MDDSLSDYSNSSLSTSSNLSEYQNEFLSLRKLTQNDAKQYREISQISNEKIEKLLKQNRLLEKDLFAANRQIERLIKTSKADKNLNLEEKILKLEKTNQELVKQNFDLLTSKNELELDNTNRKVEVNELKLELDAKNNIIKECKKKIQEQFVEFEVLQHEKNKLSEESNLILNELERVRKSELWYKNELKQTQTERNHLSEKKLENEKLSAAQRKQIESLKLELSCLKCNFEEFKLSNLKTKSESEIGEFSSLKKYYEEVISDLREEVSNVKIEFEQQQNLLEEKKNALEQVGNLRFKLSSVLDRERQQNIELLNLRKICENLKTELRGKDEEKRIYDETVNTIEQQTKLLMMKYSNLLEKNRKLLENHQRSVAKKALQEKIAVLSNKLCLFESKIEESRNKLQEFFNRNCNNETQLQVKLQEMKDKQKRYEINQRTLLRKVKEHMRGRRSAEKNNQILQELNEKISNEIVNLKQQNSLLLEEIKLLQKSEEINLAQDANFQNLVKELRSDLESCKNDKFFLQRFCSDLKIALRSHEAQNEALRGFLLRSNEERVAVLEGFPSPTCDDDFINKLLEDSIKLNCDKIFDFDESLRRLREEISGLQQQIIEKSF